MDVRETPSQDLFGGPERNLDQPSLRPHAFAARQRLTKPHD